LKRTTQSCLVVVLACACTDAHTVVGGIDAERELISLSSDEWRAYCTWREELMEGQPLFYQCGPDEAVTVECVGGEMPPCYDWRASTCLVGLVGSERAAFPTSRTTCVATIGERAACMESLAALVCYRPHVPTSECAHFASRCPALDTSDAGIGSD